MPSQTVRLVQAGFYLTAWWHGTAEFKLQEDLRALGITTGSKRPIVQKVAPFGAQLFEGYSSEWQDPALAFVSLRCGCGWSRQATCQKLPGCESCLAKDHQAYRAAFLLSSYDGSCLPWTARPLTE